LTGYDAADNASHAPDANDPNWQESGFWSWYDPYTRSGGYHHLDIQPAKRRCCIWSWTMVAGEVVHRYQSLNLPLVEDIADFEVGPLRLSTKEPLRNYELAVTTPAGQPVERISFEAFSPLLYQRMHEDGTPVDDHGSVGLSVYGRPKTGHYETMGWFRGSVVAPGSEPLEVVGAGMQDHSWGPRTYGGLTSAHRFVHMTFGPDLYASVYAMRRDTANFNYGYVFEGGRYHSVADVEIEVAVDRDGATPKRCEGIVWTQNRRAFEFRGEIDGASPSTHDGGFFSMDSYGRFRMGGRVGGGLLALRERSGPSSAEQRTLTAHDESRA
jgi:hypothetical protein